MNLVVLLVLLAASVALLLLERAGVRTTLDLGLKFKGDVKRESWWLAQYGQSAATPVAALLAWELDPRPGLKPILILAAVGISSLACAVLKRLFGRVRPGRDDAGKFLGPSWRHASWRESFPSSHSACAVALTAALAALYPQGCATFWSLAVLCALLRYVLSAHWPSDVLGGCAVGYAVANGVMATFPA